MIVFLFVHSCSDMMTNTPFRVKVISTPKYETGEQKETARLFRFLWQIQMDNKQVLVVFQIKEKP